jgi:murein L,D-transpeptidase YcbB/YkuD
MPFEGRAPGRVYLLAALLLVPVAAHPTWAESDAPAQGAATQSGAAENATPSGAAAEKPAAATSPQSAEPSRDPAAAQASAADAKRQLPPPAVPAFTLDIAKALERVPGKASIDVRDRAGLLAAYDGRSGAPIWVTPKGASREAMALAAEIRKADDWGLKASAFDLPPLEAARVDGPDVSADVLADAEVRLSLTALKYARHARGGRVEPTALTKFLDRKAVVFDPRSILEQIATASDPAEYLRSLNPRHADFERLRQRYLAVRGQADPQKAGAGAEARRLLANMEQWRWMPDDLGRFHITVNVPEQLIRVVRDGHVIHIERVVVGKVDTQTPIFSDQMEQVIFHPFWGVPDSIKLNEVLPSLRGSGAVLAKHNLRIQSGGRDIDPGAVDWSKTDIRKFHVYQPPGGGNVLGVVKFRFPNKHDVYMHDTPSKSLFKSAVRTFSHGCMRVQNPVRLAELVLAEDRRMSPETVRTLTLKDAPQNNQLNLARQIPVHITYFTVSVDEKGKVSSFTDLYGHEERISLGLEGKFHLIKPVPEPKGPPTAEPVGQLAEIRPSDRGWAQNVFSGN